MGKVGSTRFPASQKVKILDLPLFCRRSSSSHSKGSHQKQVADQSIPKAFIKTLEPSASILRDCMYCRTYHTSCYIPHSQLWNLNLGRRSCERIFSGIIWHVTNLKPRWNIVQRVLTLNIEPFLPPGYLACSKEDNFVCTKVTIASALLVFLILWTSTHSLGLFLSPRRVASSKNTPTTLHLT